MRTFPSTDPDALISALAEIIAPATDGAPEDADAELNATLARLIAEADAADLPTVISRQLTATQYRIAYQTAQRDELIALAVNAAGMTPRAVAVATGLHHKTVVARAKDPENQGAVQRAKSIEAKALTQSSEILPSIVLPLGPGRGTVAWQDYTVPLGLTATEAEAVWAPARDGHLMITGNLGSGKSALIHHLIQELTGAGVEVWPLDGGLIEYLDYSEDWPNIGTVPTSTSTQVAALHHAHETLENRYGRISRGTSPSTLAPIVITLDSAEILMDRAQRLYRSTRPKGFPMAAPVGDWLRDLLRLGRSARMHLVITQQRPDHTLFEGSVRDSFGQRISLGEIPTRESALLQWNDARLARIDSHRAPGRGLVSFADEPTTFQAVGGIRPTTEPETLPHPALAPTGRQTGAAPRFSPLMPEDDEQLSWDEITGADLRAHTPDPAPAPQDGYRRCGQLHGFADWPQALAALAGSAQSTD